MVKNAERKGIATLNRAIDDYIRSYEEIPYGTGCNIGAESRRREKAEKVRKAFEEKKNKEEDYSSEEKLAG